MLFQRSLQIVGNGRFPNDARDWHHVQYNFWGGSFVAESVAAIIVSSSKATHSHLCTQVLEDLTFESWIR
ncbi:hypothetical protein Leryth_024724 [Lithospermum erythrorhizon]|nr:hypothetical protein Leryth_024724 [Lithospermum erythrorhizon]